MASGVLVRGFESSIWVTVGRVAGAALLTGGIVLRIQESFWGWPLIVLGAAVFVCTEFIVRRNANLKRWVEDTGEGFIVRDREGERVFRDNEVDAITLFDEEHYSEGELKSLTKNFLVWVQHQADPIEMRIHVTGYQPNKLEDMIARVIDNLKERADDQLSRGQAITGEDWQLHSMGITLERKNMMPQEFRFDELAVVDIFDGHVCCWRRGEEHASVKVPLKSRNAHILTLLLLDKIEQKEDEFASQDTTGLGRILFERKPGATTLLVTLAFAVGLPIGGVLLYFNEDELWWLGLGMIALGLGLFMAVWHVSVSLFRCHERGVYQRGLTGEKQLQYTDVATFTYQATRQYYNGAYTGTTFALHFHPFPESQHKSITYNVTMQNADDELDVLRDHISHVIAGRMAKQLSSGQNVPWTNRLVFEPGGLRFQPSGFFGPKDAVFVPYENILNFDFQEGYFHVFEMSQSKSSIQEPAAEDNFYPGFFLLVMMLTPEEEGEGEDGTPTEEG